MPFYDAIFYYFFLFYFFSLIKPWVISTVVYGKMADFAVLMAM